MKVFVTILIFALVLMYCTPAVAASLSDQPAEGTPALNNEPVFEMEVMPTAADVLEIFTIGSNIQEISYRKVSGYANTTATGLAYKIRNDLVIQRWNGTTWVTYASTSDSRYDVATHSSTYTVDVTEGYYRLKTSHYVYSTSTIISDSAVRYTAYIYVD